jgi:hypothetical protein
MKSWSESKSSPTVIKQMCHHMYIIWFSQNSSPVSINQKLTLLFFVKNGVSQTQVTHLDELQVSL